MEHIKPINPEDYIEKVIKDDGTSFEESDPEVEAALSRLNKPFQEIEYKDEDSVEVKNEIGSLKFSYSQADDKMISLVEAFLFNKEQVIDYKIKGVGNPWEWKHIDSLVFSDEDGEIDLMKELLPEDYQILFFPSKSDFYGSVWKNNKSIFIIGDLTTPHSIITLLHEIGHIYDYLNIDKGKVVAQTKGDNADVAETLRKERVATAFAFKILRPFLKDTQLKEDTITYLKKYALGSYILGAKEDIEKRKQEKANRENNKNSGFGESLWSSWNDYEDEYENKQRKLYEDFVEWQKTDAYKKWKETPESIDTENIEEFGTWQNWVEKTGYEYWKDFPEKK